MKNIILILFITYSFQSLSQSFSEWKKWEDSESLFFYSGHFSINDGYSTKKLLGGMVLSPNYNDSHNSLCDNNLLIILNNDYSSIQDVSQENLLRDFKTRFKNEIKSGNTIKNNLENTIKNNVDQNIDLKLDPNKYI